MPGIDWFACQRQYKKVLVNLVHERDVPMSVLPVDRKRDAKIIAALVLGHGQIIRERCTWIPEIIGPTQRSTHLFGHASHYTTRSTRSGCHVALHDAAVW
jgi:hypothetical protein